MVHPGGAPRTVSPPPEEVIKLGEDLLKWMSEKTNEKRTVWALWYTSHWLLEKDWKNLKQRPEFVPYYERARALMANKLHNDVLEKGIAHRYLRLYDRELCAHEDEDKRYEYELKKQVQDPINEETNFRHNELMEAVTKLQTKSDIR